MAAYVALLYSIILGPDRRVVMSELRAMAAAAGLQTPRTLAATGNLVFEADEIAIAALEAQLEAAFARTFGRHVDIIVRSAGEWRRLVAANPFPKQSLTDAGRVIVKVMRRPAPAAGLAHLDTLLANGEQLRVVGRDLWMHFPGEIGRSRLATALTPKRLGVGTSRNWNTVRGLGDMLDT